MVPSTLDDLLQRALGSRYVIERELGRGGWATVYLARDTKHDRLVAIKVFRPELALSLGTGRFLQEIRLVAQFQHPHILPLHDSGETLTTLYYVMPYIAGESLRDRIRREQRMPVEEAVAITREVAGALSYAHARGVVHRDIKPENILLSEGHAIVADFGIARAFDAARDERLSHPGIAVGTPAYMAPEQALGGTSDTRGDIFSLGVVLFEMLTGKPPFAEVSVHGIVARVRRGLAPPPVTDLRPDVPPPVADALARALEPDPAHRFETARAFADALAPGLTPTTGAWPGVLAPAGRRRGTRRMMALGLAVAAIGGWGAWRLIAANAAAAASPSAVVVLPFEVRGAPEYAYLGNGMVDLLATDLDGAGGLRAVDARAVFGALGTGELREARTERGAAIARRLGAGLYVLGNIVEAGGRLRIRAALYRQGDDDTPIAQANAEGDATRVFDLVDEIAGELLAGSRAGPGARLVRLAAVSTRSLPALKAYLEGESLLRAGQADSAVSAFGRATEADTLFALAYYRRAVAADWAARFDVAREAAARAVRHGVRLAPGDRRLLRALEAFHRGDAAAAEQEYRDVLRDDPENVEAWYQLGEVLFHLGPAHGRPMTEAREAFERALHYDVQYGDALYHLLDITAKEGRWTTYDSLLARASGESSLLLRRRAVRAFARGDSDERERVLSELALASDGTVVVAAGQVAAFALDFEAADRILAFLAQPSRSPVMQAFGHLGRARLALGRGHVGAARERLRQMSVVAPSWSLVNRAALAVAPLTVASREELLALRDTLRSWNAENEPDMEGPSIATVHNGVQPVLRQYLIGLLSAYAGDLPEARRAQAALAQIPARTEVGSLAPDLAIELAAEIAHAEGRDAEALTLLSRVAGQVPLERVANSPFYGDVQGRMLRGELLLAAGRAAEARRWYASIGEGRYDASHIAAAQLGVARASERLGERAAAIDAYRKFVRLWRECDPPLRPVLEDARRRLAALGAAD